MPSPQFGPGVRVAQNATIVGDVCIGSRSSVWHTAVLRADGDSITIGERSNVQDGCVLHTDPGMPLIIGSGVSVGHRAVLHGCTVEDDVLVGMGAIVMNRAVIGAGSVIGAGAVVLEGAVIPARSVVLGVPGKVRGTVGDDGVAGHRGNAEMYTTLASALPAM